MTPGLEVPDVAQRTCSVEHCQRPSRKRGLCETHYKRWLRGRSVEGEIRSYYADEHRERKNSQPPPPLERDAFTVRIEPIPQGYGVYVATRKTVVIYVGVSSNLQRRLGQHSETSEWWPKATAIYVEWFGTSSQDRRHAYQRERELIDEHQPRYNTSLRAPESLAMQRLISEGITCELCTSARATRLLGPRGHDDRDARTFACDDCSDGRGYDLKGLWSRRVSA